MAWLSPGVSAGSGRPHAASPRGMASSVQHGDWVPKEAWPGGAGGLL